MSSHHANTKLNTAQAVPQIKRRKSIPATPDTAPAPRTTSSNTGAKKLHKPPQITSLQMPKPTPRNRLKKRASTLPILPSQTRPQSYFILEHCPYPPHTSPSHFLGVYSTIDAVTAAAFTHGAYTFSREGLLTGSEYLSRTGRIRISSAVVQCEGVRVAGPEEERGREGVVVVRLDIPHPRQGLECTEPPVAGLGGSGLGESGTGESGTPGKSDGRIKEVVFMAIHQSPRSALCIGLFNHKNLAWGACLKDMAWLAWSDELVDEERGVGEGNMPRVTARLVGCGRVSWFVEKCEVDCGKVVGGGRTNEQIGESQADVPPLPPGCRDV